MVKAREDVSKLTVGRMAVYYNTLKKMKDEGEVLFASNKLSKRTGIASSVIRRDLAYFGGFGTKGVGYEVDYLLSWIGHIMGYNTVWRAMFVGNDIPTTGIGNYRELLPPGFEFAAIVDLDKRNGGYKVPGMQLTINPPASLEKLIRSHHISIGVIAVPYKQAQKVVNSMVKAGIKGIANFSAVSVCVPDHISLSQMNVTSCLSQLSYSLSTQLTTKYPYPNINIV